MAGPQHRTPEYRAARKAYTKAQREGRWLECVQPVCIMANRAIAPDQPVDVAHDDSGAVILGPAHSRCNRTDGGHRRHGGAVALGGRATRSGGTLAKRECVVCGTTYTPTYSKQASCSRACGAKMKQLGIVPARVPARITKACASCGIHFPHDGTPRTYCENCTATRRRPVVAQRTCDICGCAFQQRGPGRRRLYCYTCSPTGNPYDITIGHTHRREVL